jgi:biotin carboxylase
MKPRVLIVFPTVWDAKQLEGCRALWHDRFELVFGTPADSECRWDFDVLGYVEEIVAAGGLAGVLSSSDYPGATLAGAIAQRLGLPGPPPDAVIRCSHKYASRQLQQRVIPDAVPHFDLLDPDALAAPSFGFPCFVKPVKGAFSIMSGRIDSFEELRGFFDRDSARDFRKQYVHMFNQLVRRFTDLPHDGRWFLAEELLRGQQVTVEGFICAGRVQILGIVDSDMYPGTGCFRCFVLPSSLPAAVQERMRDVARRFVLASGLADAFFNIEMLYDAERDRVFVIEVNPRLCGQFADLYEKVLGVNTYALALDVVTGGRPRLDSLEARPPTDAVAASFPLRVFEPVHVRRAPSAADLQAARGLYPRTLIWPECAAGDSLHDFDAEDGRSCRYAIVNLGAPDRATLEQRLNAVCERLGYAFEPL